jgi:hypothetical protein
VDLDRDGVVIGSNGSGSLTIRVRRKPLSVFFGGAEESEEKQEDIDLIIAEGRGLGKRREPFGRLVPRKEIKGKRSARLRKEENSPPHWADGLIKQARKGRENARETRADGSQCRVC